ncbi:MAG: hypothetical protein QN141_03930 [Armatimonadota bacterium]|nr:hypothetical protein [Armatimonadota bacterium]MDR7450511.1 hypothetical protein [Armatimonadota bacterium]MDR7466356.1 hypothetical protein [Armatimonadota bacterium]MDR7493077.1 hypothetical protein [Armatimonadota bacterium]MDR7498166.1 hypothetical protein [Armatimonadota bacterium]
MGTGRVLSGAGLAAVLAAVTVALLANTSNPPSGQSASPELRIPAALAGTPLISTLRGTEALEAIARLHGRKIDAVDAAVVRYAGGITVWIGASSSPLRAAALLWRMNRSMAGGTQGFSAPRPQQRRGRTVFVTDGLDRRHAYYQSGRFVLWIASAADVGEALEDLLDFYP